MSPFPSDAWEEGHPDGGGSRGLCVRLADRGGQRAHLEGGRTTGSLRMGVSGRGSVLGPALRFVQDVLDGQTHGRLEGEADTAFRRHASSRVSYTDCTTQILMQREGIDTAFSFDRDLETLGFQRIP